MTSEMDHCDASEQSVDFNTTNKPDSSLSDQKQRQSKLEDSTTIALDIESGHHDPKDDLNGAFVVTSAPGEPSETVISDSREQGIDKCLTLAVCRLVGTSNNSNDDEDLTSENAGGNIDTDTGSIEKIEYNEHNEEIVSGEENKQSCLEMSSDILSNVGDTVEKTDSDTKQVIKPKTHRKRAGSKSSSQFHDPVVELDETVTDNESVKRNNEVEAGHQRLSTTSSELSVTPIECGRKHTLPTGEVLPNILPLSQDNSVKKNQSTGRRSVRSAHTAPINHEDNRLLAINTGERASNTTVNGNNMDCDRLRCKSSRRNHRDRNTNLHRNNMISRSLDRSLNKMDSQTSLDNKEKLRPVSVFEQRYTKQELRRALPRRSLFSCHEKAMKDAGFEPDDPLAKRKAERLKARLERIANEFTPLPSARKLDTEGNNDVRGLDTNGMFSITINDGTDDTFDNEQDEVEVVAISDNEANPTDAVSKTESSKLSVKTTRKKHPDGVKPGHIDCKPLLQYLEYVRDNREEYLNHLHASLLPSKTKPTSRLISLGKAFELRHLGGVPRHHDDDVIVMAAKALRPRSSDPAKYTRYDRDRTPNSSSLRAHESMRQGRPMSEDKRRQDKNATTTPSSKEEEHAKTELERKKLRAEEWTKTVSTNTLTKAKVQSLRELGADDEEVMKWWDAFKQCHYIRNNRPVKGRVV